MLRALLGLSGLLLLGCPRETSSTEIVEGAELGVFYGGQVQELSRVPWPSESRRPTLGFRLTFREPLAEELGVRWELDLPAQRALGGRARRVHETRIGAGQQRLDQPLEVPDNVELGLWNVRVLVGDRLVLDRALRTFDPG